MWVLLNPSTADASTDDPTVRRLIDFSRRWKFGSLVLGNLFALRATDPAELYRADDPIGPENDDHLAEMATSAARVVAAWGNHGGFRGRSDAVRRLIPRMCTLRLTRDGHPGHPLYLPARLDPVDWDA